MSESNLYDGTDGNLVIAGIPIESGFPPDKPFLDIEMRGKVSETTVGSDGSTCVNRLHDRSATVKVSLQAASNGNDKLAALYTAFINKKGGIGPFLFQDLSGRAIFEGKKIVPTGWPKQGFGAKREDVEWEFTVTELTQFPGGNFPL